MIKTESYGTYWGSRTAVATHHQHATTYDGWNESMKEATRSTLVFSVLARCDGHLLLALDPIHLVLNP